MASGYLRLMLDSARRCAAATQDAAEDARKAAEEAQNEVTSIAIYDEAGDQRFVWILDKDGVVEITPPDFKTINSTGAGDVTAAYIGAHGIDDVITTTRNACAAGAIVAGTSSLPTIEKIKPIGASKNL